MDVMEQQTDALDVHTNALQILLGESPLPDRALASARSHQRHRSRPSVRPSVLPSVHPPEGTLLHCSDLASCIRLLKAEHLNTGLELMRRIQERLLAILQHSTQVRLIVPVRIPSRFFFAAISIVTFRISAWAIGPKARRMQKTFTRPTATTRPPKREWRPLGLTHCRPPSPHSHFNFQLRSRLQRLGQQQPRRVRR